ncbi:hypothetical protein A1C_03315 [Rickettsia akari str. Hartford]|uniref:Uncharacterized protein n=1 Tax=Rickettsia akari (strain Hartford) TaxID=293614 RepID=A8GNH4_RICAH|nr:hypothetical protein A1C_03315 [Rickettsia akari str. Hartford]
MKVTTLSLSFSKLYLSFKMLSNSSNLFLSIVKITSSITLKSLHITKALVIVFVFNSI